MLIQYFGEWERFLTNDFLTSIGMTNIDFVYSGDRVKKVILDGKMENFDVFKAKISKILGWNFIKSNLLTLEKKIKWLFNKRQRSWAWGGCMSIWSNWIGKNG